MIANTSITSFTSARFLEIVHSCNVQANDLRAQTDHEIEQLRSNCDAAIAALDALDAARAEQQTRIEKAILEQTARLEARLGAAQQLRPTKEEAAPPRDQEAAQEKQAEQPTMAEAIRTLQIEVRKEAIDQAMSRNGLVKGHHRLVSAAAEADLPVTVVEDATGQLSLPCSLEQQEDPVLPGVSAANGHAAGKGEPDFFAEPKVEEPPPRAKSGGKKKRKSQS